MAFTINPGSDDCYYYYYSSCSKGDSCMFRHCEAALGNETVCPSWRSGQCAKDDCMYRHMEIKHDRSNIACYWESQPGGCRKPHCVFRHNRPRDEGGTMLSEEEKLAALTSPPPQMAMPMVEDPPDLYNVPVLPQDTVRGTDSPTVERLVINPFEEETDEESVHGTPVKSSHVTRVQQLKLQAQPKVTKTADKTENAREELNFSVKSLEEIRQEKLARAKKLIEEADSLLSQEEPELVNKVQDVKKRLSKPQPHISNDVPAREEKESRSTYCDRPAQGRDSSASKVIKIAVKREEEEKEGLGLRVKSYEEILREKALASMMRAKAKKLGDQKKNAEPIPKQEVDLKGREDKRREDIKRRVVVRRISGENQEDGNKAEKQRAVFKTTVHNRLGQKSTIKGRLATAETSTDKTRGVTQKAATVSSIKSRLGIQKVETKKDTAQTSPRNSDSEGEEEVAKQPKVSSIKSRLGIQMVEVARRNVSPVPQGSSESERETGREQPKVSSIKSRLGVQKVKATKDTTPTPASASNSDSGSEYETTARQPKSSYRNRIGGIQRSDEPEKMSPKRRRSLTTITMSDFSSDGMSDSETEELERILAKRKAELKRLSRIKLKKDAGDSNESLGIKSLDEILKEKERVKSLKRSANKGDSESEGITGTESEVDDEPTAVIEEKPRKIQLGGKRKVTLEEAEASPPKVQVKTLSEIHKDKTRVKRRVQICTDEPEETEEIARVEVTSKRTRPTVILSKPQPKEKVGKRAPKLQLYRPPALKEKELNVGFVSSVKRSVDSRVKKHSVEEEEMPSVRRSVASSRVKQSLEEEEILPVRRSVVSTQVKRSAEEEEIPPVRRKNKNWGVKTFSEILREKQLKREQRLDGNSSKGKVSLEPLSCDKATPDEDVATEKKSHFSPIKFGSDEIDGDTKEVIFKVSGFTKKRSHSPENGRKLTEKIPEKSSSQPQIDSKKVKRSNVWSTRAGERDKRSVQGEGRTEVSSGSRKLSIQKRLGKADSNNKDEIQQDEASMKIINKRISKPFESSKVQVLFGKPTVVDKPRTIERPLFGKKSTALVQEERVERLGSTQLEMDRLGISQPKIPRLATSQPKVERLETSQPKKSTRDETTKPEFAEVSLKSPPNRVSTKPVKKPSTPKVVTPVGRRRSSASSTKDALKSPLRPDSDLLFNEIDESLNLEDTLELELVQLLGGNTGTDLVASSNTMEVDPDEDLLKEMEELLG